MALNYTKMDEPELIKKAKCGDFFAFAELGNAYMWLIRTKASAFSERTSMEWEDLLQEGYIGLYKAVVSYRSADESASFKTYAGICIQNQLLSSVRKAAKKSSIPKDAVIPLEAPEAQGLAAKENIQASYELEDTYRQVLIQIQQQLSTQECSVFRLFYQGMDIEQIAAALSISKKAVSNALYRIRQKCKRLSG